MGFMAGFGSAFSESFGQARAQAAQEKQDAFRLTYQDYMQRQQQYDEWNREDAKYVKLAQDYEAQYDLPEGSWTQIYSWAKTGHTNDDIKDMIETGQFQTNGAAPAPAEAASPQGVEAPQGVDSEMQATGMAPAAPAPQQAAPAPTDRGTGLFGSLLGNLAQKGKKRTQSSFERQRSGALDQVAGASGRSREEIDKVMAGYQPPVLPQSNVTFKAGRAQEKDPFADPNAAYVEQAQARDAAERNPNPENIERLHKADVRVKGLQDRAMAEAEADARAKGLALDGAAATIWKDGKYQTRVRVKRTDDGKGYIDLKTGQPITDGEVIPETKQEADDRADLWKSIEKPMDDLRIQRENAKGAVTSAGVMADIVRTTDGQVLQDAGSDIFKWTDATLRNIAMVGQKINEGFASTEEGKEVMGADTYRQFLEAEQSIMKNFDKNNLGQQKALFEIQKSLMAYRIGMAMGQEGRGLAEAERKMFAEMATAGTSVPMFYQGMADMLVPMVTSIDSQGQTIITDKDKKFVDNWGYKPDFMTYDPLIEELKTDPNAGPMWREILPMTRMGAPIAPVRPQATQTSQQPAGPPPGTEKVYQGKTYVFKGGNYKDMNNWEVR